MQPMFRDDHNVIRFRPNKIVRFLIDWATPRGIDMNALAIMQFDREEREQFAQLIGYSVSGFGDLSYVRSESVVKADQLAELLRAEDNKE